MTDLDKNTLLSVTSPILANHGNYFQKTAVTQGISWKNFPGYFQIIWFRVMRQEIFRNFLNPSFRKNFPENTLSHLPEVFLNGSRQFKILKQIRHIIFPNEPFHMETNESTLFVHAKSKKFQNPRQKFENVDGYSA